MKYLTIQEIFIDRKVADVFRALFVTILALSPAVLFDGAIWGQIDMLHSILMVCAILLLIKNPFYSGLCYSLAFLTKFQSIMIVSIFAVFFLRYIWKEKELKTLLKYILGFIIPLGIFGGYFAVKGTFSTMLQHAYLSAVGSSPFVTVHAMNIWYYAIGATPDMFDTTIIIPHLSLKRIGLLLLFAAVVLTCIYQLFIRKNNTEVLLKVSTFLSFSFFMLPTEMHERYDFPALVFAAFVLIYDPKWTGVVLGLMMTFFLNILMVYTFVITGIEINPNSGMFVVIFNCFIFLAMSKLFLNDFKVSKIITMYLKKYRSSKSAYFKTKLKFHASFYTDK